MIGFELVKDQASKERNPALRDRIEALAFERDCSSRGGSEYDSPLSSLVLTKDQADFAVDTLESILNELRT